MKKIVSGLLVLALSTFFSWANWPHTKLPADAVSDKIVIHKGTRKLTLFYQNKVIRTYTVSLGANPIGQKDREGDGKTPEGVYYVTEHKRNSSFHRALRVSYPETKDIETARRLGLSPGSDIMIHGIRNGLGFIGRAHRFFDWTAGCVALTNPEIEELFRVVTENASIEIYK